MSNASTTKAVERACVDLRSDGQAVTFTAVAAATQISRTTLYRRPDLRTMIEEHRHRAAHDAPMAGLNEEIATLRTIVEELAERVRNHETQLRRLT
jgi:hypothetical protein